MTEISQNATQKKENYTMPTIGTLDYIPKISLQKGKRSCLCCTPLLLITLFTPYMESHLSWSIWDLIFGDCTSDRSSGLMEPSINTSRSTDPETFFCTYKFNHCEQDDINMKLNSNSHWTYSDLKLQTSVTDTCSFNTCCVTSDWWWDGVRSNKAYSLYLLLTKLFKFMVWLVVLLSYYCSLLL